MRRHRPAAIALTAALVALVTFAPRFAAGTIEEQRQRLPPPARDCADPIEGTWVGQHRPHTFWVRYTLHVRRDAPGSDQLQGNIESLAWIGGPDDVTPPPCAPGGVEYTLDQPSRGSFDGRRINFGADSFKVREVRCGEFGGYYPDTFSGDLLEDYDNNEFHTLREDGYNPDATVVFRRIACPQAEPPAPIPEPPPRKPQTSGCSCF